MKKIQNFLFTPSDFKRILSNLYIFPAFSLGFFGRKAIEKTSDIPFSICLIVVIVSIVLTIWMAIYQIHNNK
jgi:hypothetical protein